MAVKEIKEARAEDLIARLVYLNDIERKWARDEEKKVCKELSERFNLDFNYLLKRLADVYV